MSGDGFRRREENGVAFYTCTALDALPGIRHGFSARHGGVSRLPERALNLSAVDWDVPSNVDENRRLFLTALELQAAHLATLAQIHSDRIHIIEQNLAGTNDRPKADAQATGIPGVALAVQVADCFPVLMADRRRRGVSAIHAGWRGTAARIASKTAAKMRERFGCDPGELVVAIGPGIRSCCFEVGPEVAALFREQFPETALCRTSSQEGSKCLLDLPRALALQLEEAGVPQQNIFDLQACTRCNTSEFFSYRGEGIRSGRMMGIIGLLVP
jgi:YfiH family protein